MRQITIQAGYEHRTSMVNIYNENEFLYPQYCRAAACIDEIVDATMEFRKRFDEKRRPRNENRIEGSDSYRSEGYDASFSRRRRRQHDFDSMFGMNQGQWLKGFPNNIIAFCARRGQGKTSAMLSVAKSLEMLPVEDFDFLPSDCKTIQRFWEQAHTRRIRPYHSDSVDNYRFYVIDPIDPTTMEHGDSVLRNIFYRMQEEVNTFLERYPEKGDSVEFQLLNQDFADTFSKLKALKRPYMPTKYDVYDELAELSESGDSTGLKEASCKLIRKFLAFLGYDMLVIQIDDADLNTSRAYEIVEDIRKYFVIPGVLVLMAVHLGTLRTCVEQECVKRYQYLLRTDLGGNESSGFRMRPDQCREMTERYIDKLLPGRHQIHLPYFDQLFREGRWEFGLRYVYYNNSGMICDALKSDECSENIQSRLLQLIYQKTGIALMPPNDYLHNFLPRRFRELTHFLSIFYSMEDIGVNGQGRLIELLSASYGKGKLSNSQMRLLTNRRNNLDQLEIYFLQHWCAYTLEKRQYQIVEAISTSTYANMTKKILDQLFKHYRLALTEAGYNFPKYGIHPSWALVCSVLDNIKNRLDVETKFEFVYAIELLYTIRMNKCMCIHLEAGDGFSELSDITGKEIFYLNMLSRRASDEEKELTSVQLMKLMNPEFEIMGIGWVNFYEPLYQTKTGYILNNRNDLLIPLRVSNDTRKWIWDPEVQWFRFSINRILFSVISDDEVLRRQRKDFTISEEDVYSALESVLLLICNFDLQYRIRKYNNLSNYDSPDQYLERIRPIGQRFDQLLAKDCKDDFGAPAQELSLDCKFQKAFESLSGENQNGEIPEALLLASPVNCMMEMKQVIDEIHTALSPIQPDSEDTDWSDTLSDALFSIVRTHRTQIKLLKKIPALANIFRMFDEDVFVGNAVDVPVEHWKETLSKTKETISKLNEMINNYVNLNLSAEILLEDLNQSDWITAIRYRRRHLSTPRHTESI